MIIRSFTVGFVLLVVAFRLAAAESLPSPIQPVLLALLADDERPRAVRVAALEVLPAFWSDEIRDALIQRLRDRDAELRRLTAMAMARHGRLGDEKIHDALVQSLGDPELSVRRSVYLALGRIGGEGAADVLVNTLAFDDGREPSLREGLIRAIEALGKPAIERLLALGESGQARDLDRVVETFTSLRTGAGAEAIPVLLRNPHLSIAQREALVRSYRNYRLDPPVSLLPLVEYLATVPEGVPVKVAALEVLAGSEAIQSEKGLAWLTSTLDDSSVTVHIAAYKVIEEGRLVAFRARLQNILADSKLTESERLAGRKALQALDSEKK